MDAVTVIWPQRPHWHVYRGQGITNYYEPPGYDSNKQGYFWINYHCVATVPDKEAVAQSMRFDTLEEAMQWVEAVYEVAY